MRHHHHHRDSHRPSPATIDSRPRPVVIPHRVSNVRSLIDFFNTQAFSEKQPKPRIPDPVPENKVKSLVINFTRLESLSAPATAVTSPIKSKAPSPWRSRAASMPALAPAPAESILKPHKHVSYKLDRDSSGDVEEVTVSGGDRRETTYKKSQEPLRSVKVWKDQQSELRTDQKRWGLSNQSKESKRPYKEWTRDSNTSRDGSTLPEDRSLSFDTRSTPSTGKWRKRGRGRRTSGGSDHSSTSRSYTTPPIPEEAVTEQRGWQSGSNRSPPVNSIFLAPSSAYVSTARKWIERAEPTVPSADYQGFKAQKGSSAISMEPPAPKYPAGRLKDSATTFGGTLKQNSLLRNDGASSSKQRSPIKARDDSWIKRDKAMRRRVPAEFETSLSESSNGMQESAGTMSHHKPASRGKTPLIVTTEASSPSGFPDIGSVVNEVMSHEPSLISQPAYHKQPRTFKDIALQRREERKKAAQELAPPETEDAGHLSVPSLSAPTPVAPLRVVKPQDPDVPTIHNPVPLRHLYSKASQDTLTSFEEPWIDVTDSEDDSTEENSKPPGASSSAPGLQFNHPSGEGMRPSMRSPSLMREMAPPRLSLRTTSSISQASVSETESTKEQKPKRLPVTKEHFAPRMKLKRDDEWMEMARDRQPKQRKQPKIRSKTIVPGDGPNDTKPLGRSQVTAVSSTSHDTTESSSIVAKKVAVRPLKSQGEFQSYSSEIDEPQDRERDRRQRESDIRLLSSMRAQRSKVSFSGFPQNFPAEEQDGRRLGDQTTAIDGVDEANPIVASRVKAGLKGKIQKFEDDIARGKNKKRKASRDRPRTMIVG